MFIKRIVIKNFRNFQLLDCQLSGNVSCIVGENNTGKTNLLLALRLAIDASFSSQKRILTVDDFNSGSNLNKAQHVLISVELCNFSGKENEEAMVASSIIDDDIARITYRFRPQRKFREAISNGEQSEKDLNIDDYRWEIVGAGEKDPAEVDWLEDYGTWIRFEELQQAFLVVYMEPLRDVEQRLRQSRFSPLSKLLTPSDIPDTEQDELVSVLNDANQKISESKTIIKVGDAIENSFKKTAGSAFAMNVALGMNTPQFGDIARSLNVILSNQALQNFSPSKNGLGMNNILYISMLLEYFHRRISEAKTAGQVLLIEEPEAHLHPQLQRVLFNMLSSESFQSIITTHSTHITSQADLSSIMVLTNNNTVATASCTPGSNSSLEDKNIKDLERYLDATRATLFYAKKIILVEGPAELFLIPLLVEKVKSINLDELGISVIPIYGVHFSSYAKLFGPNAITKKCSIICDGDQKPSDSNPDEAINDDDRLPEYATSDFSALQNEFVKSFVCSDTFEIELCHKNNLPMFIEACKDIGAPKIATDLENIYNELNQSSDDKKCDELIDEYKTKILNTAKRFGKARFAQTTSKYVSLATWIPNYINEAIDWLIQD